MRNFCKYCGKPLNPGEECTCQESRQERNAAQSAGIPNSYYPNYNGKSMHYDAETNTRYKENEYLPQYNVNVFSVVGFVLSCCGLGLSWTGGLVSGILAIIFSVIARGGVKEQDRIGKKFATAGLVIGIVDVAFFGILVLMVGSIFA